MAGMTTDELIKQVLEHGDDGCFLHGECDTYQSAPLLARRLRRAMEALRVFDTTMASRWVEVDAREALEDIEEMQ